MEVEERKVTSRLKVLELLREGLGKYRSQGKEVKNKATEMASKYVGM